MAPFYGWDSTVLRLQSHYKPLINLERIKAQSTLEPLTNFEPRTPLLGIQQLNH